MLETLKYKYEFMSVLLWAALQGSNCLALRVHFLLVEKVFVMALLWDLLQCVTNSSASCGFD